jgi:hypothetical protein
MSGTDLVGKSEKTKRRNKHRKTRKKDGKWKRGFGRREEIVNPSFPRAHVGSGGEPPREEEIFKRRLRASLTNK